MRMTKKQGGFTLVEIAIVLVIVGLLLAGVLKGQELIENSRIKAIANEMKSVQAAYNGYIDRYKAIPGDEALAAMTARGWVTTAAGAAPNNGVLAITPAQAITNTGDQPAFWGALRGAGLFVGDATAAAGVAGLPRHSGGGLITVAVGLYGQPGLQVCATGLNTKQAAGIDTLIDGTLPATQIGNAAGTVRGATAAANPLAPVAGLPVGAAYNETAVTTWTLCMPL
jgi:prepilin-type N-terminal cleavage/methylation domain-containing protein